MGAYHSFDKREAEAYARSLARQRAREALKASELEIWRELVEEQIARDRARAKPKAEKKREPRVRRQLTDQERGMQALERVRTIYEAHADTQITRLREAHRVSRRRTGIPFYAVLAIARRYGHIERPPSIVYTWANQADRLLGDEVVPLCEGIMDAAFARVRRAAREILTTLSVEDRAKVIELWCGYRRRASEESFSTYMVNRVKRGAL
jgi:hypothetical protein